MEKEKEKEDQVVRFDNFFSNRNLKLLKILLPYFPYPLRTNLILYIKYRECQITMEYLRHSRYSCDPSEQEIPSLELSEFTKQLKPYLSNEEFQFLSNIEQMKENIEMIHQLQEMFSEGEADSSDFNQFEMLFQMFQNKE